MSVDKLRQLTERGGCGAVFASLLAFAALGFLFPSSCNKGAQSGRGPIEEVKIATVNGLPLTEQAIDAIVKQYGDSPYPEQAVQGIGAAVEIGVKGLVTTKYGESQGIKMSDAELTSINSKLVDQQIEMFKLQAVQQKALTEKATDAEVDKIFSKATGKTVKDFRADAHKEFADALTRPGQRALVASESVRAKLMEAASAALKPTEDDILGQFKTLTLKRIFIKNSADGKSDAGDQIKKAQDELKKGAAFEAVMDRYSQDPAPTGKTVSAATSTFVGSTLIANPKLRTLLSLKTGVASEPLEVEGGMAIYRIESVKVDKPADFEKRKDDYRKAYTSQVARTQVEDAIDAETKKAKIEWLMEGLHAAYDFTNLQQERLSPDLAKPKLIALAKQAKASGGGDNLNDRASALVRFVCLNQLWEQASEAEKKDLRDDRVEAYAAVIPFADNVQMRLSYADVLIDAKKGSEAAKTLAEAMRQNADHQAIGQSIFNAVNGKVEKLRSAGLLKPEDEADINKELDRWKKDREEEMAAIQKRREQDEADRKAAEADKAKRDADAKKNPPAPGAAPSKTDSGLVPQNLLPTPKGK